MNPEQFQKLLKQHGIAIDDHQLNQFSRYYQMLVETNKHLNLTTITEENDVYLKHFYDSITPAFYVKSLQDEPLSICDVGSGAGFPSLPLKILFPKLHVVIIDSLNKRIKFLEDLVSDLHLSNVTLKHARAEEFGGKRSKYRESFDIVTARAVARMSVLSELCLPLVKIGGRMVALKSMKTDEELKNGQTAIQRLGGQITLNQFLQLPSSHDDRHIVVVKKIKKTPKTYPRKAGTPNKKPIGEHQNQ
ncbi:ribosomal RNA small subunit methyltransferase G [Philodulcilactobacillus myokoensis]|uniref:Ribosomal RNA small subunit methyltransferase G n=1 Tax=Philodulcilactobacillus myokoensis TaxID=2929573 RepID=A0A9W6ETH3_9LACO|nr:16S rRNA (guanine(527)-N(7))-methyltransferase RsmG [Philodulcilactobacillus myokoensis]GLB47258.1 ribosomal RNA small subunit methyltransferase G [Philodulcilactobacillus myokoensis]